MTFREKVEPGIEPEVHTSSPVSVSTSNVEVPYTDYESSNGKPYVVELFELGSHWNDRQNGFSEEVRTIEDYLQSQAVNGEIDNSLKGAKDRLKAIEKVTGMDKEHRSVVKLGVLSEYIKFLTKTNDIKSNITKWQ